MGLRKDIWRVGVSRTPAAAWLDEVGADVTWLPAEGGLRFLADPFGLWRDGRLYMFVEAYDYRDRIGRIEALILDGEFQVLTRRTVLAEPWHLSYPYVFEADGEVWMLPEAFRSGRLTLYRAADFPDDWRAAATIELDHPPIDATPLFFDGLWWLFYTPGTTRLAKMAHLHVAYAEKLTGPWRTHPGNPVRISLASARPGGTPILRDGRIVLPVQDCTRTYGGGVRPLTIDVLTTDRFQASEGGLLAPPASWAPYHEGFHTLAAVGEVTFVDAKRKTASLGSIASDLRRRFGR